MRVVTSRVLERPASAESGNWPEVCQSLARRTPQQGTPGDLGEGEVASRSSARGIPKQSAHALSPTSHVCMVSMSKRGLLEIHAAPSGHTPQRTQRTHSACVSGHALGARTPFTLLPYALEAHTPGTCSGRYCRRCWPKPARPAPASCSATRSAGCIRVHRAPCHVAILGCFVAECVLWRGGCPSACLECAPEVHAVFGLACRAQFSAPVQATPCIDRGASVLWRCARVRMRGAGLVALVTAHRYAA